MNQNGFTLIELLIYIAILALVSLALFQFVIVQRQSYGHTQSSFSTHSQVRQLLQLLQQDSDMATSINRANSKFATSSGVLEFQMAIPANNPTRYFVSSSMLYVEQGSNPPMPLFSADKQVHFFWIEPNQTSSISDSVQMTLRVQSRADVPSLLTVTTSVYIR